MEDQICLLERRHNSIGHGHKKVDDTATAGFGTIYGEGYVMRFLRTAAVLFVMISANVAAQSTLTGAWHTARIRGQSAERSPITFNGEVLLDLNAEGTKLTGTLTMGDNWPGSAPIADGKIDGNRFSFTWTGTSPSSGGVPLRTSYPHLTFSGTVDGDKMTLSMDGDYRMELKGERVPAK